MSLISKSNAGDSDQERLQAILRTNFAAFIQKVFSELNPGAVFLPNWHIDAMAYVLEQCRVGGTKRLVINIPPRNLKSISSSVALSAWILGHDPSAKIVCVSYSQELAAKHSRDTRLVMQSRWYQELFPKTRLSRNKLSEQELTTTAHGERISTSIEGTLTGRGGDYIIVDDPLKPEDANSEARRRATNNFHDSTLLSRLNSKNDGVIILVMQRLHVDDFTAHVMNAGQWDLLSLPAVADETMRIPIGPGPNDVHVFSKGDVLHPERENMDSLMALKAAMGSAAFSAQYLQQPVPTGGALYKKKWFKIYQKEPRLRPNDEIVQSWDTASKANELNDYSVCTTWLKRPLEHGDIYFLLDVYRKRLEYPDLKRKVVELKSQYRANTVLIEDKASGQSLIQDLSREGLCAIAITPKWDKVVRANTETSVVEAGRVYIPEKADWLGDFLTELMQFPNGKFDDQVDSFTQFLNWAENRDGTVIIVADC